MPWEEIAWRYYQGHLFIVSLLSIFSCIDYIDQKADEVGLNKLISFCLIWLVLAKVVVLWPFPVIRFLVKETYWKVKYDFGWI